MREVSCDHHNDHHHYCKCHRGTPDFISVMIFLIWPTFICFALYTDHHNDHDYSCWYYTACYPWKHCDSTSHVHAYLCCHRGINTHRCSFAKWEPNAPPTFLIRLSQVRFPPSLFKLCGPSLYMCTRAWRGKYRDSHMYSVQPTHTRLEDETLS